MTAREFPMLVAGAIAGYLIAAYFLGCGDPRQSYDRAHTHGPAPLSTFEHQRFEILAAGVGASSRLDETHVRLQRVVPFRCRENGLECCVHTQTYPSGTYDFVGWTVEQGDSILVTLPADPVGGCADLLDHELVHVVGWLLHVPQWFRHGWTDFCGLTATCCRLGECP